MPAGRSATADMLRLVGIVLLATLAIEMVFTLLTRDVRKAGLVSSLAVILFFTFDLVMAGANWILAILNNLWARWHVTVPSLVVVIPETVILVVTAYLIKTKLKHARQATVFLNVFSLVLLVLPLAQVVNVKTPSVGRPPHEPAPFALAARPAPARRPDIYYIILDGYARSDVMKSFFDFDNTPFLQRLERAGFYVAAPEHRQLLPDPTFPLSVFECSLSG